MKVRQKSIRVYEIQTDDFEKLKKYIEGKINSLKKYLLIIKTDNEKIKNYLKNQNLEVQFVSKDFEGSNDFLEEPTTKIVEKVVENVEKVIIKEENSTKTEIYDKIIRAGIEINSKNKLIFLKRINNGTKIYSSSEIEIFDEVLGKVICDGDYMIVKKAKSGSIIFQNEIIDEIKTLSFVSKEGIKEL